ncbi:hypothetical protein PTW37_10255 [Arthrobacter agilis]|uniref:hypothetical protein n=1 Tax=Arthrobacter agilis TaxID=37921 RepID=UPI0023660799|nr:hypothetical protein [Arthrobacter agilis]WDF32256.1 hypothetical protein PTW37_10255 [Arthrobacter agilis]
MQTVPGYPTDLTVAEPSARVTVNGAVLNAEKVTVTRELSSSLPQQVVTVSGMAAADGDVDWAVGPEVAERVQHPWDGNAFPPKPADTVTVDMGYGDVLVRQLTGKIDSSAGAVADGNVSSNVVDHIDKLDRRVSFPPHMSVMPPWDENGPFVLCNNSPIFTTDRILRACGFNATPPAEFGAVVSAPLMGSAWPEIGKLVRANQVGFPDFPPSFSQTQWGLGANSIDAEYTPISSPAGTNRIDDKTFQISLSVRNVAPAGGTNFLDVTAWWGTTARLRLRVGPNREIQAISDGTFVASMSAAAAATADQFTLTVNPSGNMTIYANNGATVTGTRALPSIMATSNLTRVTIAGTHLASAHVGGLQVSFYSRPTYAAPRTAVLTPSASNLGLPVMRRIDNQVALDLIKEQAEAECAVWYLDEYGVFRWTNRNLLTDSTPTETIQATGVFDLGWDSHAKGVRSRVVAKSDEWAINRSPVSNQTLWQGTGASLESGQTHIEFAEPDADVEWFGVNTLLRTVGNWSSNPDYFNRGIGTFTGGTLSDDSPMEEWVQLGSTGFTASLEPLGLFAYKFTVYAGTFSSAKTLQLRTLSKEADSGLRSSRRSVDLDLLRGKAKAEATPRYTTGVYLGPAEAAELEHMVGSWVQDPLALQETVNFISLWTQYPRPFLRDLDVVPDPRRQLGDIVWVEGGDTFRVRLKVLLTYVSTTVTASDSTHEMDQTIGGRVLEAFNTVTNAQLDLHKAGRTNTQFDTLWAGAARAQFDADPLGRG